MAPDARTQPIIAAAVAAAVAAAITLAVAVVPFLRFAYVSAATRVSMDTVQAFVAGLVAYFVYGRYQRSRARSDLLLMLALGLSSAGNLVALVIRAATEDRTSLSPFASWSGQAISLLAAVIFASAALLPDRTVRVRAPVGRLSILAIVAVTTVLCVGIAPLANDLPENVQTLGDVASSRRPELETSTAILAIHLLIVALRIAAAVGFARRAQRARDDELLVAVSAGLAVAAVARFNFVLYPSLYTNIVHTGDVLRLAFYLLLVVGAEREIRSYWRDRAQIAVLDERRRIARELHDGLTQELSFIRSQISAAERGRLDPAMLAYVAEASERALDESRRAIRTLSDVDEDALDVRIRRAIGEVADRGGLAVTFDLAAGVEVDEAAADHLVRIAREAAVNATRHAAAGTLHVSLRGRRGEIHLVVTDDGRGIAPDVAPGFGLRGMYERADALGAVLTVDGAPSGGTQVRVVLPIAISGSHA